MKRKVVVTCILTALSLTAGVSQAKNNNRGAGAKYDFAELRFVNVDAGRVDGDGISIGGSYRLNREVFLEGNYTDVEFDGGSDVSALSIGGGYIYPYQDFDLLGKARLINEDSTGDSDSGFGLAFGLRHYLTQQVEVRALYNYVDVDETDTFFEFSAEYHLDSKFSVGLTFDMGAENDTWSIGGRYYY